MPVIHLLVDFDNVKPSAADIALARTDQARLAVVRGPQPARYEADLAEALHSMGSQVTFTRCAKAGKNAADMQIAYLLGELVATLPASTRKTTRFIVISKDRDFDPLLAYLQDRGFDATRAVSFRAALGASAKTEATPKTRPAAKKAAGRKIARKTASKRTARKSPAPSPALSSQLEEAKGKVIESLRRMGEKRPAKRKGLERHIESHLGRKLAPHTAQAIVAALESDGVFRLTDKKVEYSLPKAKA